MDVSKIKNEYEKGMTCTEIGIKYGYNRRYIGEILRKNGIVTKRGKKPHNIKKKKFGFLTVISTDGQYSTCRCDCGTIKKIRNDGLKNGHTKSCGCYNYNKLKKGLEDISGTFYFRVMRNAKNRNIVFDITIKDVLEVWLKQNKKCAYTNLELYIASNKKNRSNQTASLDRIDSNIGYVKGNIQFVHKKVNMMKGQLSDEEFLFFCREISDGPRGSKMVDRE